MTTINRLIRYLARALSGRRLGRSLDRNRRAAAGLDAAVKEMLRQ